MITSQKFGINKGLTGFVPFFPQMRPERKPIEVSEDAKMILNLIVQGNEYALSEIKEKSGLSNKKWDKAIKELTRNKLAKVSKTENGLIIELV